ncbi:MAG: hypothetical protein R3C03_01450 [Pirellulaceae bacterium]
MNVKSLLVFAFLAFTLSLQLKAQESSANSSVTGSASFAGPCPCSLAYHDQTSGVYFYFGGQCPGCNIGNVLIAYSQPTQTGCNGNACNSQHQALYYLELGEGVTVLESGYNVPDLVWANPDAHRVATVSPGMTKVMDIKVGNDGYRLTELTLQGKPTFMFAQRYDQVPDGSNLPGGVFNGDAITFNGNQYHRLPNQNVNE